MKNRLFQQKLQRGCRLRDGRCFDGKEEETDLRTRGLMEDVYGSSKLPTLLPTAPYAACSAARYFTLGTKTKLTKENKSRLTMKTQSEICLIWSHMSAPVEESHPWLLTLKHFALNAKSPKLVFLVPYY